MPDPILGKSSVLPYDVMEEQSRFARKRKLIDALRAKSMGTSDPTINTGRYVVPNFADPIARYVAYKDAEEQGKSLDVEEKASAEDVNRRTPAAMEKLINSFTGHVGPDYGANPAIGQMTGDPNADLSQGNPGSLDMGEPSRPTKVFAPDPIRGIGEAYASGLPEPKAMAQEAFKAMVNHKLQGGMITPEKLLPLATQFTTKSIQAALNAQDINLLVPRGQVDKVDNKIISTGEVEQGTGPAKSVGYFGPTFAPAGTDPNAGVSLKKNLDSGEISGSSGVTTPIPQAQGVAAFSKQMMEDYGKDLSAGKKSALDSLTRMPVLQDAFGLIDQSIMGKPWSEVELTARKLGQAMGWSDDRMGKISSTEAFTAAVSQDAMETLKALRPASNVDLEYANKLTGGNPVTDPKTAKILVSLAMSHSMNSLMSHQENVSRAKEMDKLPGMGGMSQAIHGIYDVGFGGEGTPFQNPEKYGVEYAPATKRFKSKILSAGGNLEGKA